MREAKVDQSWPPLIVDEYVGRLDVTVDDPHAVGMVERIGEPANDPSHGQRVHLMMVAIPPERVTAHKLIGDPAPAVVESGVEDGYDVGMVKSSDGSRLPEETLHHSLSGVGALEHLDSDVSIQPGIVCSEHFAESAVTQVFAQLKPSHRTQRTLSPCLGPVSRFRQFGRHRSRRIRRCAVVRIG
jgi:hypothetical protein